MDEKRHSWGAPHGMPPVWGWLPSLLLRWQLLLIIPSGIQLFPWPWPGHGKQLNTRRNNLKIFISLFWGQFSGYKTLISFFLGGGHNGHYGHRAHNIYNGHNVMAIKVITVITVMTVSIEPMLYILIYMLNSYYSF